MKISTILLLMILTPMLCFSQIIQKDRRINQKNLSLGVIDNYYVTASIQHKHLVLQPVVSLFTTRLQEEYWLLNTSYNIGLGDHFFVAPSIHLGGNLSPEFNYVYAGILLNYNVNRIYVSVELLLGNNNNSPFKIHAKMEYEAVMDKLFFNVSYRPNQFLTNDAQYFEFGLAIRENKMSIKPAFQIPDDLNFEKLQFLISFNYYFHAL